MSAYSARDEHRMRRALELAGSARLRAAPNPWVGAVIVHGDDLFEGATEEPGRRHAEVVALSRAPASLVGATVYVTLEPCMPFPGKRTPSCALALVDRRVSRVVIALQDPDPRVRGRGIEALRAGGVDVVVGVLGDRARALLAPYARRFSQGARR